MDKPFPSRPLNVGILLYPDVEVLDFAGPFEVFCVASRILPGAPFTVVTIAETREALKARHGLTVTAAADFAAAPALDILVVPGGVVTQAMRNPRLLDFVTGAAAHAHITASVCTGAFLLAKAGVLTKQRVTTHWEDIADLRAQFPDLTVLENLPFVEDGDVVTSAGISAGIGMSLHLVQRILGADAARRTARQMDYAWSPSGAG